MKAYEIEESHQDQIPLLAAIELSAVRKFIEFLGCGEDQFQHTLPIDLLKKAHSEKTLLIATQNKTPIGFLAATKIDAALHIHEVSVAYESQGHGIGKDLIARLIKLAKEQHIQQITLTTDKKIPWNMPFYERLGFVEVALKDCAPGLNKILTQDKSHAPIPDNRIAMIFDL